MMRVGRRRVTRSWPPSLRHRSGSRGWYAKRAGTSAHPCPTTAPTRCTYRSWFPIPKTHGAPRTPFRWMPRADTRPEYPPPNAPTPCGGLLIPNPEPPPRPAHPVSGDPAGRYSTGISAAERAHTLRVLADPTATAARLIRPGHILPLRAVDGGV